MLPVQSFCWSIHIPFTVKVQYSEYESKNLLRYLTANPCIHQAQNWTHQIHAKQNESLIVLS